jgi:uncharacterized protein YkwD
LTQTAQLKADDMAENDYFSHISPNYGTAFDMLKSEHISYGCAAENLASGQHTAAEVVDNWMHSDGHRANILSSELKELGVGFATQSDGTTYWVQMFIG